MEERHNQFLFPLTSLQIGDMQSYVSKLHLHVNHERKKLVFFVDNAPWNDDSSRSKPVELWQLMVIQSRNSPFANRSQKSELGGTLDRDLNSKENVYIRGVSEEELLEDNVEGFNNRTLRQRLFEDDRGHIVKFLDGLFEEKLFRKPVIKFISKLFKHRLSIQELSHILYGCVAFEIEWSNVRGINYVNELQTDTSVALEVKLMVKRGFHDFDEGLNFYGVNNMEDLSSSLSGYSSSTQFLVKSDNICRDEDSGPSIPCTPEFSMSVIQDIDYCLSLKFNRDCDHEQKEAVCYFDAIPGSDETSVMERNSPICNMVSGTEICEIDGEDFNTNVDCVFLDASQCCSNCQNYKFVTTTFQDVDVETKLPIESSRLDSVQGSDFSDEDTCSSCSSQGDDALIVYKDVLLLFRFDDPMLPLQLKNSITSNQKLLKMLESGLPSWVIFMQSYPFVCKFYRPWMWPLARTMYVFVSIITVIIGFYDLYKNVPVFKATAARLCGPLFEWIEDLEMISRIKYLGTVLFLQNWERAFRSLLSVITTVKKVSAIIMKPMIEPLEIFVGIIWWPVWNIFDSICGVISVISMTVASVFDYTIDILQPMVWPFIALLASVWKLCIDLVQVIAWPVVLCLTAIWNLAIVLLYPIIYTVWSLIMLPLRLTVLLLEFIRAFILNVYNLTQNIWILFTSLSYGARPQAEKTAKASASTLRLLWNDIFSQVFRAVRSIINGLVAFFTSCNRHRFSIYNNIAALIFQLKYTVKCAHLRVVNTSYHALDKPFLRKLGYFEDDQSVDGRDSQKKKKLKCSKLGLMPRYSM